MIFQVLDELYDRLSKDSEYRLAQPGRSLQKIAFVVVLEPDGELFAIQDARDHQGGRATPRIVEVLGITKPSGSGFNPCFLWDTPAYLLGWDTDKDEKKAKKRRERARQAFAEWRDKHLSVEAEIDHPDFSAVCRFAESWDPDFVADHLKLLQDLGPGYGVFQIRGRVGYVHEEPRIQEWWDVRTEGDPERMRRWWLQDAGEENLVGQCLVTGQIAKLARFHPKIKGVRNAQSTGATIAGFNDEAYCSYGFKQSYNAPVSSEVARRYVAALNALLDGPMKERHRVHVGETTVVFWTEQPTVLENIFAKIGLVGWEAKSTQDEELREQLEHFFSALRQGREAYVRLAEDPDRTRFFVLGLAAPTPARIAVRFFHESSVTELMNRLREHHRAIRIERRTGKDTEPEFPSASYLWRALGGRNQDPPPLAAPALLESMITGRRYPDLVYHTVLRRIGADKEISYARAALLKGYLVRNLGKEVPVTLDPQRLDPAYRLGRLFAVLEKAQSDALPDIKATIRDRYYSSASATPRAVFPRLLRTYQHHLGKLDNRGHITWYEKLVQEILDPLDGFPAHLDLAEQGLFALGYYHQRNDLYKSKQQEDSRVEA